MRIAIVMLVAMFAKVDAARIPTDRVDQLEVNHVHDRTGRRSLSQIIAWRIDSSGHTRCDWWRQLATTGRPVKTRRGWELLWHDDGRLRRVVAASMVETWTQHDPELRARRWEPVERRRGMVNPRVSTGRPPASTETR